MNRELKRLLVASVGDDLQYQFERASREKNHLVLENEALTGALRGTAEQLERMSIQGDVWRSKFLASRYGCAISTILIRFSGSNDLQTNLINWKPLAIGKVVFGREMLDECLMFSNSKIINKIIVISILRK